MHSDRNAAAIVSALRKAGAMVVYLDPEGGMGRGGLPDLLVASRFNGKPCTTLLEVKGPRGKLNPDQESWHVRWAAAGGCPVVVVRTVEDAFAAVGLLVPE